MSHQSAESFSTLAQGQNVSADRRIGRPALRSQNGASQGRFTYADPPIRSLKPLFGDFSN
jgi:hypothetical protein